MDIMEENKSDGMDIMDENGGIDIMDENKNGGIG